MRRSSVTVHRLSDGGTFSGSSWNPRHGALPNGVKKRLDVLLVERGLAETRSQAQALVLAGRVRGHDKAGDAGRRGGRARGRAEPPRFVSRGGEKLAHALDALDVDVDGRGLPRRRRLDRRLHRLPAPGRRRPGAARSTSATASSTSDCAQRPAGDRARAHERARARLRELPFAPTFVDLRRLLHRAWPSALPPGARLRSARRGARSCSSSRSSRPGRADVGKGGVVRDPAVHRRVLREVARASPEWGGRAVAGIGDSGLPGPKGNREFFLYLLDAAGAARARAGRRGIDAASVTHGRARA